MNPIRASWNKLPFRGPSGIDIDPAGHDFFCGTELFAVAIQPGKIFETLRLP